MRGIAAKIKQDGDIGPVLLVAAGLFLLAVKLVLCTSQRILVTPLVAVLDDNVAYESATWITQGLWLGPYSWLTLAKHSFFSLWLAGLNFLHIPYLLGGQLLWAGGALAAAWAMAPALKKRWLCLLLFAVLLFSPSSVANPPGHGFITRVYRDNIFPQLCLLCVAGMVGFALRYNQRLRRSLGWLVTAGLALAACWLTREDGWWLLPFVIAAAAVCGVFILRGGAAPKQKLARCLALALPFALLAGGLLGWSAANLNMYRRFIVSDFTGGEFAAAYGALMRVEHGDEDLMVAMTADSRRQLYALSPRFAELAPYLEDEHLLAKYSRGDGGTSYYYGAFYWALREAAANAGYYWEPEDSRDYFTALAAEVNAICDAGLIKAGPRRSGVSPPIRGAYVAPVLRETAYSLWFCATFQQCSPRTAFSPGANDPAFYEEVVQPMEEYLHGQVQRATAENSAEPEYTAWQKLCYFVFDILYWPYALLTPPALLAALAWQVWGGVGLVRRHRGKEKDPMAAMLWLVGLGLLFCILFRAAAVSFMEVSSFGIGTYVMYLASVHPLMLLYGFIGVWQWAGRLRRQLALRAAHQNN